MCGRRFVVWVGCWILWIGCGARGFADIRLPKIFSDQMVLQRGESIAIWGTADPHEALTIQIADRKETATADAAGNWRARLAPPIGTGPFELTIQGAQTKVVFQQVVVGEVWICAGQLNMHARITEQPVGGPTGETPGKGAPGGDSNGVDLRMFHVPLKAIDHPQTDFTEPAVWGRVTADSPGDVSALAFHFGRRLAESLGVPVGVIVLSTPEGSCESWIPWENLASTPEFQPIIADWSANEGERLSKNRPGNLFNGMVRPLTPLNVRGVIWYLGESEVGRHTLLVPGLPLLLASWREAFQQPDLRFGCVQVPPFRYQGQPPEDLPRLWEIQAAAASGPGACLIETWDMPPAAELTRVDIVELGNRQAHTVLAKFYERTAQPTAGPRFQQATVDGRRIRVAIDGVNTLQLREGAAAPDFQICGSDHQFQPAQFSFDGSHLWLWSDAIETPVAVRYAWKDTPQLDVVDGDRRPIPPFRSDRFGVGDEPIDSQ